MVTNFLKTVAGRKLTLALLLTLISTVFILINKADFSGWANFQMWIYGTFVFGNGVEHIAKEWKK